MSYNKIKVANITNLGFRNFGNGRAAKGARKRHHMGLDLVFDPIKPQVYEMPLTVRRSAAAGVCVYNIYVYMSIVLNNLRACVRACVRACDRDQEFYRLP